MGSRPSPPRMGRQLRNNGEQGSESAPLARRLAAPPRATQDGLVDLGEAAELLAPGADHSLAQLVEPLLRPCGSCPGSAPAGAPGRCRRACGKVRYQIARNHRAIGRRVRWKMIPAVTVTWHRQAAPDVAVAAPRPVPVVAALRTDEALRQAQPAQVVEAVLLAGEGGLELKVGLGEGLEHCASISLSRSPIIPFPPG